MLTLGSFLSSTLGVVAVLAHAISVVRHIFMPAPPNLISVFLFFNLFSFRQSFIENRLLNARNRQKFSIFSLYFWNYLVNKVRNDVLVSVERVVFSGIVMLIFEDSVLLFQTRSQVLINMALQV